MLPIHDQFTHQMRNCLKASVMGLGLVRLLQDAGRTAEARATLHWLENGSNGISEKSNKPKRRPRKANRLKGVARTTSCSSASASTGIHASETRTQPLCIA
jgi:hypothetical protein